MRGSWALLLLLGVACGDTEHHRLSIDVVALPQGACPGSGPVSQFVVKALGDFAPSENTAIAARIDDPAIAERGIPSGTRVLTVEGRGAGGELVAVGRSAELLPGAQGVFSLLYAAPRVACPTQPLAHPRAEHTATLLANGKVLIAGGVTRVNSQEHPAADTELYDPARAQFVRGPDLYRRDPLLGHTATRLADGRVLVFGGQTAAYQLVAADGASASEPIFLASSEQRAFHATVALPDGGALIVGGCRTVGADCDTTAETQTLRFDGKTDTLAPGPVLATARLRASAYLRADGLVAVVGGSNVTTQSVELIDPMGPAGGSVHALATGALPESVAVLVTGQAVLVGGAPGVTGSGAFGFALGDTAPRSVGGALNAARQAPRLVALEDGSLLVSGGLGPTDAARPPDDVAEVELYHPDRGSFEPLFGGFARRSAHTATRLLDGSVLLVGGRNPAPGGGDPVRSDAEVVVMTLTNAYSNLPASIFGPATPELVPSHAPLATASGPARVQLRAAADSGPGLPGESLLLAGPSFDGVTFLVSLRTSGRAGILLSQADEAHAVVLELAAGQPAHLYRVAPAAAGLVATLLCSGQAVPPLTAADAMPGVPVRVDARRGTVTATVAGQKILSCSPGVLGRGAVGVTAMSGMVDIDQLEADR